MKLMLLFMDNLLHRVKKIKFFVLKILALTVVLFGIIVIVDIFKRDKAFTFLKPYFLNAIERRTPFGWFYAKKKIMPYDLIDQETVNNIYELMQIVDKIFKDNKIEYIICSGTLLGSVRHGGLIPWDDDLDVIVLNADWKKIRSIFNRKLLKKLHMSIGFGDFIQIGYKNTHLDIFVGLKKKENGPLKGLYGFRNATTGEVLPYFELEAFAMKEIYPLKKCKYGHLQLPCPNNPNNYLDRYTGSSWRNKALVHNHTRAALKIVTLNEETKKPALPSKTL